MTRHVEIVVFDVRLVLSRHPSAEGPRVLLQRRIDCLEPSRARSGDRSLLVLERGRDRR